MAFRKSARTKLSKGILEMKFMKKSKDQVMKEIQEEEGKLLFENQITDGMKAGISNYILESSFIPCENLIEGRLSFRGMNPEIERLLELEEIAKRPPVDRSMGTDVTDSEMARFRGQLVETVASKYKTKKGRKSNDRKGFVEVETEPQSEQENPPPRKKQKFLKPEED